MRLLIVMLPVLLLATLSSAQHDHPPNRETLLESADTELSVELDVSAPEETAEPVVSPEGRYRAYVSRFSDVSSEQLFIEDIGAGTIYRVRGLPFPNRPISNLTWYTGGVLAFDRSVSRSVRRPCASSFFTASRRSSSFGGAAWRFAMASYASVIFGVKPSLPTYSLSTAPGWSPQ